VDLRFLSLVSTEELLEHPHWFINPKRCKNQG